MKKEDYVEEIKRMIQDITDEKILRRIYLILIIIRNG